MTPKTREAIRIAKGCLNSWSVGMLPLEKDACSHLISEVERLDALENRVNVEKIVKVMEDLATQQMNAVISAVNKRGLMNTEWDDVDQQGGKLDFNIIATAIVEWLRGKD